MKVSFIRYTITLWRYDEKEGLLWFRTKTYDKPSNSYILICDLLPNTLFYYELVAEKEWDNGRRFTTQTSGQIRTTADQLEWELECPGPVYNAYVEWDFDREQILGSDVVEISWSYRLDEDEVVEIDNITKTTYEHYDHYSLYLSEISAHKITIMGDVSNTDYLGIVDELEFNRD